MYYNFNSCRVSLFSFYTHSALVFSVLRVYLSFNQAAHQKSLEEAQRKADAREKKLVKLEAELAESKALALQTTQVLYSNYCCCGCCCPCC
jgi:hypothetical protein